MNVPCGFYPTGVPPPLAEDVEDVEENIQDVEDAGDSGRRRNSKTAKLHGGSIAGFAPRLVVGLVIVGGLLIFYFVVWLNMQSWGDEMQGTLQITGALADRSRLRVFAALTRHEELCVCQITAMLGFAPATVSRHMSLLLNARLVQSRKSGRWVYYRLATNVSPQLLQWLDQALAQTPEILADDELLAEEVKSVAKNNCKV